jgi:hypothetical protein
MFSGVFIVEVDGTAVEGSGDTIMVDVYRHTWDLSEHVPDVCLFQ